MEISCSKDSTPDTSTYSLLNSSRQGWTRFSLSFSPSPYQVAKFYVTTQTELPNISGWPVQTKVVPSVPTNSYFSSSHQGLTTFSSSNFTSSVPVAKTNGTTQTQLPMISGLPVQTKVVPSVPTNSYFSSSHQGLTTFSSSNSAFSVPVAKTNGTIQAHLPKVSVPSFQTIVEARKVVKHDANNYIIIDTTSIYTRRMILLGVRNRIKTDRSIMKTCLKYASNTGCNIKYCFRFHVCQFWIKGYCRTINCKYDHHFGSEANRYILRVLESRNFGEEQLKENLVINFNNSENMEDFSSHICVENIFKQCKREKCVCYHANSPYVWEAYIDGEWIPFSMKQNEETEKKYSNPNNSGCKLYNDSSLLSFTITINFENMSLFTPNKVYYHIRRLSTPSDMILSNSASTRWLWYWQECNGEWIFFKDAVVNDFRIIPFSDYIETQFLKKDIFYFTMYVEKKSYNLDFVNMTQTNESSLVSMKIRRRPMPIWNNNITLPSLWTIKKSDKIYARENISSSCLEFSFAQNMIRQTLSTREMNIERVENPHLWQAYQVKKAQMMITYGNDTNSVNEQYMFHGTSKAVVDKICSENFDWRLHGTNSGNKFGKGTYFANIAKYSNRFAATDEKGYKWMFIVLVLVGTATVGNSNMVIPPIDPVTQKRFDSTVNDQKNPTVYVKYNLEEYYPAYIVHYKE